MHGSGAAAAERLGILGTTGWLADQPEDFQARIALIGSWILLGKGKRLYIAGDEADAMYGLAEGHLDVMMPVSGDEEVTLHRAPPGFWIGDGALMSGVRRSISVEAATDCRLFKVALPGLRRNLDQHPGDWMYLHRLSFTNATLALQVLAELAALPPRARFARLLLRLADEDGEVRATQEELGRMTGMSRAAFRRALASLFDAGVLRTAYGGVSICDFAALREEADRR